MSADLRLIVHTTKGDTNVLASKSACNRLSKAGLADTRRAIETEDRRLHVTLELQHSKILDDSLLDLLKTIVILIKNLLSILEIEVINRHVTPREIEHELDIIILYAVVRRAWIISLKLSHLLVEDFLDGRSPCLFLCTCTKLSKLLDVIHSELLLDGLELIVQEIFSLLLINLCLHLLVDFLLDLLEFNLGIENRKKLHRTGKHVTILEKFHLVHEILHLDCCRNEVYKEFKTVNTLKSTRSLTWNKCR